MLKMLTFFQGLPGQQPVSGAPDFPRSAQKLPSTSEAESEASMSEASSEDLVPSLEAEVATDRDEEEAGKKKKKSKGLATMISVFTKGRKKKGQPSLSETEGESESSPRPPAQLPTVEELKADLERGRLEAARPLLALELELQEAAAAGRASEEELVRRQSKVEALYALLRDQVLGQLRRPLEAEPERLRQALAVLAEQERQDHAAAAAAAGPPGCPGLATTRPRGWLQLWRDGVAQAAAERLSRRPAADAEGRTEAERTFLHMGRTMKEDLEAVVERLKPLFPADIRVVAAYAESYHAEFASQLSALTQFELCQRDTYMLLLWVQNLYPNDILNSPKLAPELQGVRLGTLLPPTQIRLLEATFLSNEVASVRELTARALELESNRWTNDEAPQRLDGHCHSELAIDIIQIISQGQAKAESITLDKRMTVKLGDGGGGEDGLKRLGKRSAEEDSLEGEGPGGGDAAEESGGTKRDGKTPRDGGDGPQAPSGGPQAPSPPPACPQDQHHFLRSSVRPQSKRLRKDSSCAGGSSGAGSSGPRGKGADGGGSSAANGPGVAPAAPAGGSRSSSRNLGSSGGEKEEGKKVRRQWESWSTEDKNTFFEGLYEHGKDFEAIQNNIALKYRKKGRPAGMVKNKEQVRHFYYRTWHKITKYIDFDNVFSRGLKKSSQELYGLICYGELRKKIGGCMDDKNATKLNELIQAGATTVRYKGRNLRIKAPMCRALKKLCDPDGLSDEEDQKPVRLPLRVPVELQPRNNHAWARVQSLAQNPRLRMIVELHRKVSSLIEFLKQKWALHEVRIRKTLEERQLQDSFSEPTQEKVALHLFPGENCTLTPLPGVARVVHSKAFCTVHWQEGGRCKQSAKDTHTLPPAQILGIQSGQGTARGQLKCPRAISEAKAGGRPPPSTDASQSSGESSPESAPGEGAAASFSSPDASDRLPPGLQDAGGRLEKTPAVAAAEGGDGPAREPGAPACACGQLPDLEDELSLLDPFPRYMKSCQDLIIPEQGRHVDPRPAAWPSPEARSTEGADLARTRAPSPVRGPPGPEPQSSPGFQPDVCTKDLLDTPAEEPQEKVSPSDPPPQGQPAAKPPKDVPASRLAQQLREEGWNLQTSESLTLAEVYLMMGKPSKLQLEYDWLAVLGPEASGPHASPQPATFHKQRLLSCLLKLISTEVNPRLAPETNTGSTASVRPTQEEQSTTPPGKVVTVSSRSPRCPRNQAALRHSKAFSPSSVPCSSGLRNPPRPLLVASPTSTGSSDSDGGLFAVPTTLPPNSRHGKLFFPNKETELTFRQHLSSISMQSDFFLPKPRKLRNRHLRKPLVVQRTLLPRPSENQSHNVCSFSILSNSSVTGRGSFRPVQSSLAKAAVSRPIVPKVLPPQATGPLASAIDLAAKSAGIIPGSPLPVLDTDGLSGIAPLSSDEVTAAVTGPDSTGPHQNGDPLPAVGATSDPFISVPSRQEPVADSFQNPPVLSLSELSKAPVHNGLSTPLPPSEASSTRLSPPNVSALLDISLPGPPEDVLSQGEPATHISDSIIEIAISSGQYGEGVPLSPAKLNGSDSSKSLPSPSSSPQPDWIASPTHDPQWCPSDPTDSSLSSLFASFISPEKSRKMLPTPVGTSSGTSLLGPSLLDGSSRDSFVSRSLADVAEVVDSQLVCMMNENSVDYISRFNDLAQELSIAEPGRREALFDGGGGGPPVTDLSQ